MNDAQSLRLGSALPADDISDDGRWEIGAGCVLAGAFFVLFLGWAAFTPLDSAAQAQGEVTIDGHRQTIQHREGGPVSALFVHEGQKVQQGQVLMELAGADAEAQFDALSGQVYSLQAQRARLQAEQAGSSAIVWPVAFRTLQGSERVQARQAMQAQEAQFHARAAALRAQQDVLAQKAAELSQQAEGYRSQVAASDEQHRLLGEELEGVKSLAAEGYAPQSRVRSLQRSQAEINGQRGQYLASIAQAQEQTSESRLQILQLVRQHAEEIGTQLRDVQFQLSEAEPKLVAARDRLARQQVRATTAGTVVGLSVFNVGSVVAPGQRLMDIVPDKAGLVITARVSPSDADSIHVASPVEVKFPSLHDRAMPILKGYVQKMSADSLVDEKTGARYFQLEASVPPEALRRLKQGGDGGFDIKPGLPAEVIAPLRKRTALQYLLEPLTDSLWRSLREK
jgi:HlyD family secretion protein